MTVDCRCALRCISDQMISNYTAFVWTAPLSARRVLRLSGITGDPIGGRFTPPLSARIMRQSNSSLSATPVG
eukprot:5804787-Pyramimonas_sp.AAC.1